MKPGGITKPAEEGPPPPPKLPPGWRSAKDADGNEYYYNKKLGVTQWEKPVVQSPEDSVVPPPPPPKRWHPTPPHPAPFLLHPAITPLLCCTNISPATTESSCLRSLDRNCIGVWLPTCCMSRNKKKCRRTNTIRSISGTLPAVATAQSHKSFDYDTLSCLPNSDPTASRALPPLLLPVERAAFRGKTVTTLEQRAPRRRLRLLQRRLHHLELRAIPSPKEEAVEEVLTMR